MKYSILRLCFCVLCMVAILPVAAQQTRLLTADKSNDYGVVYQLPQTGIEVTATATRTVSKAGPFFRYAAKFIGTDKVVREDNIKWELTAIGLDTYGVADPEATYVMQLKPGSAVAVAVAEDGMLLGINTEPEAPRVPVAYRPKAPAEAEKPIEEYLQYVDEDFLACQSTYKQAEMLASNLMDIREARIALTRGTAETMPTDGRQLEIMLANLQNQEDAIKRAFTGEVTTETYVRSYTLIPSEEGESILFRMSDFAGFVEPDDLSGSPVRLSLKITSEAETPLDAKGEPKKLPKDAVAYNVPATGEVSISHEGKTLAKKSFEFGQFGITFGLQPSLFSDKKEPYEATFSPESGALRRLAPMSTK